MCKWYALFVKSGKEEVVKKKLNRLFIEKEITCIKLVVPKHLLRERKQGKMEERIRNLLPGYVLLCGDINTSIYSLIKRIPDIYRLLGREGDKYAYISEEEIALVGSLIKGDETIGYSNVEFRPGRKIEVLSGPLKNFTGNIVSVDKKRGRVRIMVPMAGHEVLVTLGINIIGEPL